MRSRRLDDQTLAIVLDPGETVMERLVDFARDHSITGARLSGIGAFSEATVGFYDPERKDYARHTIDEQVEVLSFQGNLSTTDEGPRAHVHVTVSRRDGAALGGHLFEARVWPTLEIFVALSPVELTRRMNDEVGLPLIDL